METRKEDSSQIPPTVSVIVLNYNGARSIAQCLESVREQTYPQIETLVVDNNSSDGSMELVARMFPTFKRIYNRANLGFAQGNNVGIRNCGGDFVVLVNNDLILDRDAVSKLVSGLSSSPRVGILGGVIYHHYSPSIWAYGGYFEPVSGMHWQVFQGYPEGHELPLRLDVDYVPGALLVIRRKLLEQIGLLGQYFFLYGDDIDLACKVKRLGYTVEVTSTVRSRHMVSQSVKALDEKHKLRGYYFMNRSMFYLCLVQLPAIFAVSSTISQIVFGLFETSIFGREGAYVSVKIKALADALKDLALVRNERGRLKRLGRLPVRPRLNALFRLARSRGLSRTYYW